MARIETAEPTRSESRSLVISEELTLIRQALDGIRLLVELGEGHLAPNAATAQLAPVSAVAIAVLVGQRLRAVERAARGSSDPAELIHPGNVALGADGGAQLAAWSVGQRQEEAERLLRRLEVEKSSPRSRRRQR